MSTTIQLTTVPADLIGAQGLPAQRPLERPVRRTRRGGKPPEDDGRRLVIRETLEDGLLVYAVLDRATGQVMAQIPREQAAEMAARPDYSAGQVVDTKV